MIGKVYNLEKVSDFACTFTAAEAGIAVSGGAGASTMKNQNGVIMNLTSTQDLSSKFRLFFEVLIPFDISYLTKNDICFKIFSFIYK